MFIDTLDQQPPNETNQATLMLGAPYMEGTFYINAHVVLEEGWAYGTGGNRLHGKFLLNAISAGGSPEEYHGQGRYRFPIRSLLAPFDQIMPLICAGP